MKLEIEINKESITELVTQGIVKNILSDRSCYESIEASYGLRKAVENGVKEYIYINKNYIIEKVIDRAVIEIVRKTLPKLLQEIGKEHG